MTAKTTRTRPHRAGGDPIVDIEAQQHQHSRSLEEKSTNVTPSKRIEYTDTPLYQEPPRYAPGYPRVAGFMACGGNLAVFRKFDRMAYLSTLHQQSKLLAVEREIDDMDALDYEFMLVVDELPKEWDLEPWDLKQFHKEQWQSNTTVSTLDEYLGRRRTAKECDSVPFKSLDALRWIEIVFKNGKGLVAPYIILRGNWRQDVKNEDEFTISLVFTSNDPYRLPMVIMRTKYDKKDYTEAASWNIKGSDVLGNGPFKPSCFIGKAFQNLLVPRLLSRLVSPISPDIKPTEYDSTTLRLIVCYKTTPFQPESETSSAIAIASYTSGPTETIMSTGGLRCISQEDASAGNIPQEDHDLTEFEKKFFSVALEYVERQRFAALKDRSVMVKSSRQEDVTRVNALNRLESLLVAYRSTLITNVQMSRCDAPTTRGLATLRHWFQGGEELVPSELPLQGAAQGVYTDRKHVEDLVAVGAPSGRDYLSRMMMILLPKVFKIRKQQPMQDLEGAYFYSDTKITALVSVVGAFLGVGLLIGAIVGLDQLDTKAARLGLICALTVAFAMVLLFTTTTTRGEVFGATAAYAAVLVVYVGGALGNSPSAAGN
ncbi:hypothetical protein J1614_003236 [Plenodomus biglobosus]|nr:hypothetical protein J1614_003236 [Plenodomus biglobosus]